MILYAILNVKVISDGGGIVNGHYEPAILQAYFTSNPVYEGQATELRVVAADLLVLPQTDARASGEFASGEV